MTPVIGFAGLSHLGIVSSIAAAAKGFQVIAYDPEEELCSRLEQGYLAVSEPGLQELLETSRSRIRFSSRPGDLERCDVIYFSLDIPTDENDRGDVAPLAQLIEGVTVHASPGSVLVVLSQVPVRFTRKLSNTLEEILPSRGFQLYYQVETLIIGHAVERALHPDVIIVGCGDPARLLAPPYTEFTAGFGCPVMPMGYESAELAKISINAFLASSVSLANTMAEICEAVGADWSEVSPVLKMDQRIGPKAYLQPGLGLSGGHLERDIAVILDLAVEFGTDSGVPNAWLTNSRHRRDWVLKIIHSEVMSHCTNPTVAIWGLAYKPDTNSTKNSPALELMRAIAPFTKSIYDPEAVLNRAGFPNTVQVGTALEACPQADVLVITTSWPQFSSVDLSQVMELMAGRIIIDPFGILDSERCTSLGFSYFTLGSPAKPPEGVR